MIEHNGTFKHCPTCEREAAGSAGAEKEKAGWIDPATGDGYAPDQSRLCVEPGCNEIAGTPWTDHWCPSHDEERRNRISANLDAMSEVAGSAGAEGAAIKEHREWLNATYKRLLNNQSQMAAVAREACLRGIASIEAATLAQGVPPQGLDARTLDEETAIHRIIDVIDNDEGGAELYEAALALHRARLAPSEATD